MKKKKIVFVINYFYPDLASTGQLMTDLCRGLVKDYEITVIAAQPSYAGEKVGEKNRISTENYEGIKIIRIKLPKVNKLSKLSRFKYIISYFFFGLYALLKEKNISLIYTISQPPILGGLIGTLGKIIKRKQHIYNIQDFNPEQAIAINYSNGALSKIAMFVDKLNCKLADKVIVVGSDMAQTLKGRFKNRNVPDYEIINNWTNDREIVPLPHTESNVLEFRQKHDLINKFVIMYSGNLGLYYDLENLIKITNHFKGDDDIRFVFIGEGAIKKQMIEYVTDNNINNVLFLPYQPLEYIKYSLNAADLHLVVNQKGIKGVSVPSKIYGVLAAGKPILGVLEKDSEAYRIINESQSGTVIEPNKYEDILEAINSLRLENLEIMGLRGREYLENHLTKERSINKYRITIEKLLG